MIRPGGKTLEDLASIAGGAVNIIAGLRTQIRNDIRARMDEALAKMDVVPREDYDRLEQRIEKLSHRVEALEDKKAGKK